MTIRSITEYLSSVLEEINEQLLPEDVRSFESFDEFMQHIDVVNAYEGEWVLDEWRGVYQHAFYLLRPELRPLSYEPPIQPKTNNPVYHSDCVSVYRTNRDTYDVVYQEAGAPTSTVEASNREVAQFKVYQELVRCAAVKRVVQVHTNIEFPGLAHYTYQEAEYNHVIDTATRMAEEIKWRSKRRRQVEV